MLGGILTETTKERDRKYCLDEVFNYQIIRARYDKIEVQLNIVRVVGCHTSFLLRKGGDNYGNIS